MPITIQPAQTSNASLPYDVMKPLPYPYHIDEDGSVGRQDFWRGSPSRLLGFQRGGAQRIVLTIEEFVAEPERAVGLCPVFLDEPSTEDKALLTKGLNPSRSPGMWADTRPITKVNRYERTPE